MISNDYNQINNIEYANTKLGNEMWVQVCGRMEGEQRRLLFCALIDKDTNVNFLDQLGIGIPDEEHVGFTKIGDEVQYFFGKYDNISYLVRLREFHGIRKSYYELCDEFLLNFNAYRDGDKYFCVREDGTIDELARYLPNGGIQVKNSYLRRFAAIKQMNLAFEFDFTFDSVSPFGSDINEDYEYRNERIRYEFYSGDTGMNNYFSRLLGRKIIDCGPIESSGVWPFEKEKEYVDFIVGCDENGNPIRSTCDHNQLNNIFSSKPGRHFYLTPVAFKREVLKKYMDHPGVYRIEESHLYCGRLWGIELDLNHGDYVFAYLGDLGRDLPESEYPHWLAYNVLTDEGLSENTIKRDFLGLFTEATNPDFVFRCAFERTKNKWFEKYGWDLFMELTDDDKYCYQNAIMPLVNEQHEFDSLCLTLSKIAIDSINVERIKNADAAIGSDNKGSLNVLQDFLINEGLDTKSVDSIIGNMRIVQSLRSQLTGHRKSIDIEKTYKKFGIDRFIKSGDFVSASRIVFELLTNALNELSNVEWK